MGWPLPEPAMNASFLSRLAPLTEGVHLLSLILWCLLALGLTVALVACVVTRWGRSQPMRICIVLSLWAHVMLAGYAATVQIVANAGPGRSPDPFEITIVDADDAYTQEELPESEEQPWERLASGAFASPEFDEPLPAVQDVNLIVRRMPQQGVASILEPAAVSLPGEAPELMLPKAQPLSAPQIRQGDSLEAPQQIDAPTPEKEVQAPTVGPTGAEPARTPLDVDVASPETVADAAQAVMPLPSLPAPSFDLPKMRLPDAVLEQPAVAVTRPVQSSPAAALADDVTDNPVGEAADAANGGSSEGGTTPSATPHDLVAINRSELSGASAPTVDHELPQIYKLRALEERAEQAKRHGGSPETEAAVEAGLAWFVANQSRDGRWAPAELEGGRGRGPEGRNRQHAGANADYRHHCVGHSRV